uniref:Vacuolar import/degradation Vid27 C-terminal domain-containing protein n=1 Tax=Haptolina brevifila TaxID=156173 RepID=A0A7S2MCB8_9EUKA|mmetsp:Transcript_48981/g.97739  ORF Transcript_48981/g.97739 Transcript_48981/m.97739 type:complete len:379 (+) Transcript_48981:96-1232(+)|eukprot:CAMPEP_0174704536 /NCGR_PEP_ID=MMETSP1094-20130205/8084_1 /TAXON_ID=156173 /ORGANISM="Chrysochromulina brevifilum, Strain UTEX LB 985" /LENGTH=378 /DNA_ID=CAMNT_0015902601 /DNA_START=95 /DNA_END=1231 /DNA_ORIENTATION=+
MATPHKQILDAGPRGGANLEAMSALSTGKKGTICFFKGDENGTAIGSHKVHDFNGVQQNVGMVQTWNQSEKMLMTTEDKRTALLMMDTEVGSVLSELSLKRQQKNWNLTIDSVTPMQKFEQYKQSNTFNLFGLGDEGKTVFALSHDARAGQNVEEFVVRADASRKYKSYVFTCHAQTKGGNLVLGRTDGGVALYDAIMQSENASCVLDGMPGPVTSIDVAADGSMVVWTTPEFVFFSKLAEEHWSKGTKRKKPAVLQLAVRPDDLAAMTGSAPDSPSGGEATPSWMSVRFDAGTAKDELGLQEREIITYSGSTQMRWSVSQAVKAWEALDGDADGTGVHPPLYGTATAIGGAVFRHVTVKDDLDVVALEGEIVKSLRF